MLRIKLLLELELVYLDIFLFSAFGLTGEDVVSFW